MTTEKVHSIPFDEADYLDSEETIAAYLAEFEGETDANVLARVQDSVARARARLAGAAGK